MEYYQKFMIHYFTTREKKIYIFKNFNYYLSNVGDYYISRIIIKEE